MSLAARLEFAITELRVQMLSTEVLFGFQLQGTFRPQFAQLSAAAHNVDVVALTSLIVTLAALIAAPAQHRIVERGNATRRLLRMVGWLSGIALVSWGVTFGCDAFIVSERYLGRSTAVVAGVGAFVAAMGMWFWLPRLLRQPSCKKKDALPEFEEPPLREKLNQMLREAWVALPGATGLFGFQLAVTQLDDFTLLPTAIQRIHFVAAAMVAASILILITPGQLHRVAYQGRDDNRAHDAGTRLLSLALAPLAIGVSADYYVAVGKVVGYDFRSEVGAVLVLVLLLAAWYLIPWTIRLNFRSHAT